jgi:large subunit ribosomal protein L23Ae
MKGKIDLTKKRPKYVRRAVERPKSIASADIIRYGLSNENVAKLIERDNTLVFICDYRATKPQIKSAVVELYGADVLKVRTLNTPKGEKKAYIRLKGEGEALRIANKAGIV